MSSWFESIGTVPVGFAASSAGARLRVALGVTQAEAGPVAWMLGLSILVGIARTIVFTAGYGLFLEDFSSDELPWVFVAVAGLGTIASASYLRLADRVSFRHLTLGTIILLTTATVVMWLLARHGASRTVVFLLPVWCELLYVLTNLIYWALAGKIFDVQQAKRLYGLLGSGDEVAEILIGAVTPLAVALLGAVDFLALGALSVAACVPVLLRLLRLARDADRAGSTAEEGTAQAGGIVHLLRSRYLVALIVQIVLAWICYYALEQVFYDHLERRGGSADANASFIGVFFAVAGVIGIAGQAFGTPRLLKVAGVSGTVLVVPVALVAIMVVVNGMGLAGSGPAMMFVVVAAARFVYGVLAGIAETPATMMMYQPIPSAQRDRVLAFSEGVVYPMSVGAAGLLLLLLTGTLRFDAAGLSVVLLGVAVLRAWSARVLAREYPLLVRDSLKRRVLDDRDVQRLDADSLRALEHGLEHGGERQARYSLELLARVDPTRLSGKHGALLRRPEPLLVRAALSMLESRPSPGVIGEVENLLATHPDPEVRAAALRARCALNEDETLALASHRLADPDPLMRRAAVISLFRFGGIHGVLAASRTIAELEAAPGGAGRIELAAIIGEVANPGFYQPLLPLLESPDDAVFAAGAHAAGLIRHPRLIPPLARALSRPRARPAAARALLAFGSPLADALDSALAGSDELTVAERARLIAISADAPAPAPGILRALLGGLHHPDARLRLACALALTRSGATAGSRGELAARALIGEQMRHAARLARATIELREFPGGAYVSRALQEELEVTRFRSLALAGLLGRRDIMRRVAYYLHWGRGPEKAMALEMLETALDDRLRGPLVAIADETRNPAELLQELAPVAEEPDRQPSARLKEIAGDSTLWPLGWTRAAACHALGLAGTDDTGLLERLSHDSDEDVAEHARWALAHAGRPSTGTSLFEGGSRMLTIEKVAVLKSTDVFAQTPDHVLSSLAKIAREQFLAPGDAFINEGALEDAMYVVVDGEVQVEVGGNVVATLGASTVVGEMQVIDPAPRSATVRAKGAATLFKIDQAAFEEVMADRPEIARAVNRMLVRRLRAAQAGP